MHGMGYVLKFRKLSSDEVRKEGNLEQVKWGRENDLCGQCTPWSEEVTLLKEG